MLGIGIFLLPIVFAWFTLRKGYSAMARIVSFGWLAIIVIAAITGGSEPSGQAGAGAAGVDPVGAERLMPEKTPEEIAAEQAAAAERSYRRDPAQALSLETVRGNKGGFDTVLLLGGTIKNAATFDIKDPVIACVLMGPSGTEVGTVRETLYEIVPAGGSKRFAELNMGFMGSSQVANFNCRIMDADVS